MTGKPLLNASQAYPVDFGREVARLFAEHKVWLQADAAELTPEDAMPVTIGDIVAPSIAGDAVYGLMRTCLVWLGTC